MLRSAKRLILVFIFILGGPAFAEAQVAQHRIVFSQPVGSTAATSLPNSMRTPMPSLALFPRQRDFYDNHAIEIAPNHQNSSSTNQDYGTASDENLSFEFRNIGNLVPLQTFSTTFVSEARVPVTRLWGTRLQLDFSLLTIRNGNVTQGSIIAGEDLHPPRQSRSTDLYGFGVTVPLGRSDESAGSKGLWQSVARVMRDR
jgi:hypothetical protein